MTLNKAARNERLKITATWLNGSAIAALAVGCFAPITAFATGTVPVTIDRLALLAAVWLFVSLALHVVSRQILGRIEE